MSNDWRKPDTFEEYISYNDKRIGRQERRPNALNASDLVGVGIASTALELMDWNADEALFNGFFYSYPNALNSPDETLPWTGQTIARADGTGMQQVWNTDDPDNMRYWVRTYSPTPGDETNVVYTAWSKFASPTGYVDTSVIHPDVVADIEQALQDAADAMEFATTSNRVFRQTTAPTNPTGDYTLRVNDVWYDTDDDNQPYLWTGSAWTSVRDLQIEAAIDAAAAAAAAAADAIADAEAAMDFAETKTQVYRQATSPSHTGAAGTGVWYDTDDGNRLYIWSGSAWVEGTTAWVDTNLATSHPGIQISPSGLTALDAAGVATFNITATTGAVVMKGSLTSGSDISGATITGGTVQTEATASRGIKMNSTGLTVYNASGVATMTITAATGAIALLGDLTSGSTVTGATVTGGTLQSEATASRGVKITSAGMNVYNTSGTVVFSALANGTVTASGQITTGGTIDGAVVTGGTLQTEATASRGIKINSSGLTAYNGSGSPTFTITAATGSVTMLGDLLSGSTITSATVTGGLIRTATSGNRVEILTDSGVGKITFPLSVGTDVNTPGYIASGQTTNEAYLVLHAPHFPNADLPDADVRIELTHARDAAVLTESVINYAAGFHAFTGDMTVTGNIRPLGELDLSSSDGITGLGRAINRLDHGSSSASTNGSGIVTVSHDLGVAPVTMLATRTGTGGANPFELRTFNPGTNNFQVQVRRADTGALVTSTAVDFDWLVMA